MRLWIGLALLVSATSTYAQALPPIPKDSDPESVKAQACQVAISEVYGWQLGEAKRLRDWCRQNDFITYKQQIEAERMVR